MPISTCARRYTSEYSRHCGGGHCRSGGRVTPEEADAAAAVVVLILVLLSLIPLFHGLVQSVQELRAI
jgi:hypothetical protein